MHDQSRDGELKPVAWAPFHAKLGWDLGAVCRDKGDVDAFLEGGSKDWESQALYAVPAAPTPVIEGDGRRWLHKKRGTSYTEITRGSLQSNDPGGLSPNEPMIVYRGDDGKVWIRDVTEFEDGRFEAIQPETIHGPFYHVTQNEKDMCEICARTTAIEGDQREALDKLIQRHASAYVARGGAISDSIIVECIASREALLAALRSSPATGGAREITKEMVRDGALAIAEAKTYSVRRNKENHAEERYEVFDTETLEVVNRFPTVDIADSEVYRLDKEAMALACLESALSPAPETKR